MKIYAWIKQHTGRNNHLVVNIGQIYIFIYLFIFSQVTTLKKQTRNDINKRKYTIMLQY